jgi:repressor LexA
MCSLTERQREVLEFIARFSEDNAYPPTVREIGEHFSVSLRAVQDHIAALQKKGYISLCPKRSRSIRVLKDCRTDGGSLSTVRVPVLKGLPSAGQPLLSEGNIASYIVVAESAAPAGAGCFALQVPDDSMRGAGILAGDTAVIRASADAEDGQIVAAVVENALLLRRFCREASRVCLQPEDSVSRPVYFQDARIEGVLSCIIRTY